MRIGMDASRAASAVRTGTENYSLELAKAMLRRIEAEDGADELVLYSSERLPLDMVQSRAAVARLIPFPRLWTHLRLSIEMVTRRPDVLFVPAHVIPLAHPRASVATIHDLGHLYHPEAYPPAQFRYLDWATKHNARCAAHLLADSEATKQDLIERLDVHEDGVTVVYPGVAPHYFQPLPEAEQAEVLRRYRLDGPYLLYVGTLQPRKNVERLVQAFTTAVRDHRLPHRLVIAGKVGWMPQGILDRLQTAGDRVVMAGYVPDADLPALYAGATATVLPSLYEGFGMPLAEAMATGCVAIGSTAGSLPEVVGDAGLLVEPEDTAEIAEALAWVCEHPDLCVKLAARGRERAARFTWDAAAATTLEVLRAVGEDEEGLTVRW